MSEFHTTPANEAVNLSCRTPNINGASGVYWEERLLEVQGVQCAGWTWKVGDFLLLELLMGSCDAGGKR